MGSNRVPLTPAWDENRSARASCSPVPLGPWTPQPGLIVSAGTLRKLRPTIFGGRISNGRPPPGEFSTFNRIRRVNANGPLETNRTTRCSRTFVYNRFVHGNVTYINFGFLPPPSQYPRTSDIDYSLYGRPLLRGRVKKTPKSRRNNKRLVNRGEYEPFNGRARKCSTRQPNWLNVCCARVRMILQ